MLAFLDRVPPEKAVRVRVEPGSDDVLVWNHNGKHYVRTSHTLMWPRLDSRGQRSGQHQML